MKKWFLVYILGREECMRVKVSSPNEAMSRGNSWIRSQKSGGPYRITSIFVDHDQSDQAAVAG